MMSTFGFLLFVLSITISRSYAKCNCEYPQKHYEGLGCKPVYEKPDDCCPTHYDCTERIAIDKTPDKCYFSGKIYDEGESVDHSLTERNCIVACNCRKDNYRDFICAHIDCPEFFGHPKLNPGCYSKYKLGSCCSSGTVCPPFDGVAECKVGDKIVHEGQRFGMPDDECTSCVCQKGFTGKNESPFCEPVKCGMGLMSRANVISYCAPLYYGNSRCCPIGWECKKDTDKYDVGSTADEKTDTSKFCRFGNTAFKLGDKFPLKKEQSPLKISCECRIPPLVHCVQEPHQE